MVKNGLKKIKKDHRNYSYNRTFGLAGIPSDLPKEYNCDAGLGMPDQNALGMPFGCTGMTQSELGQDEDGIKYDPHYTYDRTRDMEGTQGQNVGCDLKNSLKSTIVYGLKAEFEATEQAISHRRGGYFEVERMGDYFDSFRTVLWIERYQKRAISVGVPWFSEFESIGQDGILPIPKSLNTKNVAWHNAKISGWKSINGILYLCVKSWQGENYGDNGWCYMSRELCNQLFNIRGTGSFTLAKADPANIQKVKLTILETMLSYLNQMLNLIMSKKKL